jgi:hypothetical protein
MHGFSFKITTALRFITHTSTPMDTTDDVPVEYIDCKRVKDVWDYFGDRPTHRFNDSVIIHLYKYQSRLPFKDVIISPLEISIPLF